jgi:ankyrin repeat protein
MIANDDDSLNKNLAHAESPWDADPALKKTMSWTGWAWSWFVTPSPGLVNPKSKEEHALFGKLMEFCDIGDFQAVDRLLKETKLNPDTTDDGLSSALLVSAERGDLKTTTVLLDHGSDPNQATVGAGVTPLSIAAQEGHVDVVAKLLAHRATNPNQARTDDDGHTPLVIATLCNHADVVSELLAHSAIDPNLATVDTGCTPLSIVKYSRADWYRHHGFATDLQKAIVVACVRQWRPYNYDARIDTGATPLLIAAANGRVEIMAKLLEHSATDPNQASAEIGATPLYIAAQNGHVGAVAKLLEHHATDPNKALTLNGATPLCIAVHHANGDVVAALLRHSAIDPNMGLPRHGPTPLIIATQFASGHAGWHFQYWGWDNNGEWLSRHLDVLAALLVHPATDLNQAVENENGVGGFTPLGLAEHCGGETAADMLLEAGAIDRSPKSWRNLTPS